MPNGRKADRSKPAAESGSGRALGPFAKVALNRDREEALRTATQPRDSVVVLAICWLAVASALAVCGPAIPMGTVLLPVLGAAMALAVIGWTFLDLGIREWLAGRRYRDLLGVHLLRILFLGLSLAPPEEGAGTAILLTVAVWESTVALWAALLLLCAHRLEARRSLLWAWNAAGAGGLVLLAASLLWGPRAEPVNPITRLFLLHLPPLLLPLISAGHAAVSWRLKRDDGPTF